MNTTQRITKLAYESIDDTYSHAEYGDFKVIMNIKTGYINATKLCADGEKQMKNWMRNDNAKELVECVENNTLNNEPVLITDNSYGLTRGTYAHPDLIPHIASWVSPKFAIKVSKIVNNFLIREREEQLRKQFNEEKSEMVIRFEELEKRSKELHENTLKAINDKHEIMYNEMMTQHHKTHNKLDETQNTLDTVSSRIEIVIDEVVPPSIRVELHEEIGIMELNDSTSKYTHKVFCRQNKSANNAKNRILRDYPQATLFREINPSPNSKNFLHNLKDLYGTGATSKLKIHYNYISMNGTNDELNEMINNVLDKAKSFGL
jgi:hypothetical protein